MKKVSLIPLYLFLLLLLIVFAGCAGNSSQSNSSPKESTGSIKKLTHSNSDQLQTIRAKSTLRVGVSLFVPWVMYDHNGELIGYEIDVARKLAEDMGVEVEFIKTSWPVLITDLLADEYDIIISGLSVTPQRSLLITFSEPYSHSSSVLIANSKLAGTMTSKQQFNNKNISMGTVRDSMGEQLLKMEFPMATHKPFNSESQAIAALLDGKIHAMLSSTPRTGYLLSRYPTVTFQPFKEAFSTYAEGFAIRKGDVDLLNFLNTWIQYNTQNNWLTQQRSFWFDTIEWTDQLLQSSEQ